MSDILIPYGGGADLGPVTATAADVRKGKVIVDKNGNPLTGTMAEKGAATYTPGRSNQTIAANQYLTGAQTIRGDANLLAANILYGKSIFGVAGNIVKYYYAASSVSPTSAMSMGFNTDCSEYHMVYYYQGTVPSGVTLLRGFACSGASTEEGSNINFESSNLNFVYKKTENGSRLYQNNISSYRYQSGTSYRLPLGTLSQEYKIVLLGIYN